MSTILITGATSGIGRHAALHLARRGHHVIASGRRETALATLAGEARELELPLDCVQLDVTDADAIARAVASVESLTDGQGLDVLINNAGYGQGGAVLDVDDDALRRQYDTNVFGLLAVTRAFAPQMVARRSGRIINVSSIGGFLSMPLFGVYASTKHALEALSDALRIELASADVKVVVVQPGAINTSFNATLARSVEHGGGAWSGAVARGMERMPLVERLAGTPADTSRVLTLAVESARPRARYLAPRRYAWLGAVARRLPSWVLDAVLSRALPVAPSEGRLALGGA